MTNGEKPGGEKQNRSERAYRVALAAALAVALVTCAVLFLQHRSRSADIAAMRKEAAALKAEYDDTVARKESLEAEIKSIEAEEKKLELDIANAKKDASDRSGWVEEIEGYLSREAAASEEAWRLEREIAGLEALSDSAGSEEPVR